MAQLADLRRLKGTMNSQSEFSSYVTLPQPDIIKDDKKHIKTERRIKQNTERNQKISEHIKLI